MSEIKISQLTAASTLAGTEVFPVVQGGTTKKATIAQLTAGAQAPITFPDVTGTKITWYTGFVTGYASSVLYHDVTGSQELRISGTSRLTVSATAVVAGGVPFRLGSTGPLWTSGSGSPEGVVTAPIGSLYSNTSGSVSTALYRKTSGSSNTGWTAVSNTATWG